MSQHSSMLHVRVDEQLKAEATQALAGVALTLSEAVRILLTRIVSERGLPAGLASDPAAYDAWFRAKVREALDDTGPAMSQEQVMGDAQKLIHRKSRVRA